MDTTIKAFLSTFIAAGSLLAANTAMARGEIYSVTTEAVPATPSSYTANGVVYRWGLGMDLKLKSFEFRGKTLQYNPFVPDRVATVRVDNPNANGTPCAVFAQTAGAAHSYQPTLPPEVGNPADCSLATVIAGNTINIGALDVFSNSGPRDYALKNIERIDLIFSNGIIAPTSNLGFSGHTVMEKNGNNTIQIAAILELGKNGKPAAYGPLVKVNKASFTDTEDIQYGQTNVSTYNDFLSNESKAPQGFLVRKEALAETQGFAFVSLLDLGIKPGQKYFGVSAFGPDVDPTKHNLLDPTTFPQTTGGDSGDDADFHIGTAGNFTLGKANRAPIANPDTAVALTGIPLSIAALTNDSDPDGDPLTLSIVTPPRHGGARVTNGQIIYASTEGFTGEDFLTYRITDGNGGETTARVTITVKPVPKKVAGDNQTLTTKIIETGLEGHGAGGMGWLLLPLFGLFRVRRQATKEC